MRNSEWLVPVLIGSGCNDTASEVASGFVDGGVCAVAELALRSEAF